MKTKQEIDGPNVTIFIKLQVSYKKLHYFLHSVLVSCTESYTTNLCDLYNFQENFFRWILTLGRIMMT